MVRFICIEPSPLSKLPKSKITELTNDDNHNEQHRSCVVTLSDMELNVMQPCHLLQTLQDPTRLNYDQVFMRDLFLSALALLMKGELNFLVEEIACLQSFDLFKLGQGVMSVDSGLWWIILPDQTTSPTMLSADRCSMMHRRVALFTALRCVLSFQDLDSDAQFVNHITKRIQALSCHLHSYYWLDFQRLNDNHHYRAEENLHAALNKFNVMPESIPDWIFDFMPSRGEFFIGNVSPARIDFCCFCLDYFIATLSSLATEEQAEGVLNLVEEHWLELIEICYRAMVNQELQIAMNILRSAESPNCQRAMHLFLNLCLPEGCDTSLALLCAFGVSMIPGRMGKPMQAERSIFQRAVHCFLLFLILVGLWFCGVCDADPGLCCDDNCSLMIDSVRQYFSQGYDSFPDISCADGFSMIVRRMAMECIDESGSSNRATISLDDLDKFIVSYLKGIGLLRRWCETNGKRIDLSSLLGTKMVVFTTPPVGNFSFTFEKDERDITLSLYGRDLYIMGWRGPQGTFEIKAQSEKRKNYMSGERVTVLPFKKNYRFLAPDSNVGKVRLGFHALSEAFEVLYKCCGESSEAKGAISIFAANIPEAGRLQSVLKDVCDISLESSMATLDSRSNNSFWVNNYGHYSRQEMRRIDELISGKTPKPIKDSVNAIESEVQISEEQILNQIRIFPIDGYERGIFKHAPAPLEPTEDANLLRSTKGRKNPNKPLRSKRDRSKMKPSGLEKIPIEGDGECSSSFPLYLLEDWCLGADQEEKQEQYEEEDNVTDQEQVEDEDEINQGEVQPWEDEVKYDDKLREDKEKEISSYREPDTFKEFLDHFPAVRRLITTDTKGQSQLQVFSRSIEKITCPCVNHVVLAASQDQSDAKESALSYAVRNMELGAIGRRLVEQRRPVQRNLLLRAGQFIRTSIRFAL